jgi:hypothetical protein
MVATEVRAIMPAGEINVENDGWIRSDGIQTELKEDETGPYVEVTAFMAEGQDGLIGKVFDRMKGKREIGSVKLKIFQSPKKTLHFEFGGCKGVSGSWRVGASAVVTFRCYKAGALVAMGLRSSVRKPVLASGPAISPIALALLAQAARG